MADQAVGPGDNIKAAPASAPAATPATQLVFSLGSTVYDVNLVSMTQTNRQTGFVRTIRRTNGQWEWEDRKPGSGDWKPFKAAEARQLATASSRLKPAVHTNVCCDVSNMYPIVGTRYRKIGHDYDLCDAEFKKLSEQDKQQFEIIRHPGFTPTPYSTPQVAAATTIVPLTDGSNEWEVDVVKMTQKNISSGNIRRVRRTDQGRWEWEGGSNGWNPYNGPDAAVLAQAHAAMNGATPSPSPSPSPTPASPAQKTATKVTFTLGATQYDVDVVTMIQTNLSSTFKRRVRCTDQGQWEYEDGARLSGDWKPYNSAEASALGSAYANAIPSIMFTFGSTDYDVNLVKMTQINRTTAFVRKIRVTDQGEWEWEDSGSGSGDWQAYGATEAAELKNKYQGTVRAMRSVEEKRILEAQQAATAASTVAAAKSATVKVQAVAAAAAAPGAASPYLVLTRASNRYDVDLVKMKQTNRTTNFVRAIRVTSQSTWEWEDGAAGSGDWKSYGITEAARLQKAYEDFKSSPQSNILAPPAYWSPQANDGVVKYIDVKLDSQEATPLVASFRKTADKSDFDIVKIDRIQNLSLWQRYTVFRMNIMDRATSGKKFEIVYAFHGSDEDTLKKIVQQGFNRNFHGKNANYYGIGDYFARDATYSAQSKYAAKNANGEQRMLMCRVSCGEWCEGKTDAKTPDVLDPQTMRLYDSTVDNCSNPQLWVTYNDAQAYAEYLITFKAI